MDNLIPQNPEEPLALRPIDRAVMDLANSRAQDSPRARYLLRYHEFAEQIQRMVNAIEPHSYVRPHQHATPPKVEVMLVLRGSGVVVRFDEAGRVLEATVIAAGGPVHGAEIPPTAWHTLLALEPGTIFYEVKDGPYVATTDKEFATWAPPEQDTEGARLYMDALRAELGLGPLTPSSDALIDAALEDDLP